ncbi:hypothetical protein EYF80_034907 [Liparis tanakae]|uniref:Uncharacterized protein n=1 Tax=Liparis tanakae TaxID=230148 RepID=A0A4Z2GMU6_9TELE|nr:hypothetical protein EYF80_034907 [Liparis tanakae]
MAPPPAGSPSHRRHRSIGFFGKIRTETRPDVKRNEASSPDAHVARATEQGGLSCFKTIAGSSPCLPGPGDRIPITSWLL